MSKKVFNRSYLSWSKIVLCLLFCNVDGRFDAFSINNGVNKATDCSSPPKSPSRINQLRRSKREIDNDSDDETSSMFWLNSGQNELRNRLANKYNMNVAKNIIFFMGDGMSIPTVTAARIYSGQLNGANGEECSLSFEKFPFTGLSKTYCIDKQVADSACTATAYLCGIKGNYFTIGVNGRVALNDCKAAHNKSNQAHSLLELSQRAGKRTGIVTTTRVTHASPAGAYAHTSNRDFECDADVTDSGLDEFMHTYCEDHAKQLVVNDPGKQINVIFGGGQTKFLPNTMNDTNGNVGERNDGRNLIDEWKRDKPNAKFIYDKKGLDELNIKYTDHVLGLFSSSHMDYNLLANRTQQPSLEEMTKAAIKLLQKDDAGYFLFVEGGKIDLAHHGAEAVIALDETVQFSKAIQSAVEMTNTDDTLIIVTSDHAHTMSISGFSVRGNDITGLNSELSDVDGLPYTTLSYANGPGYSYNFNDDGSRKNLTDTVLDQNYVYAGTVPLLDETHGGDDVAVFARGCYAHLFSGVYEQSTIPHLASYASCLGDGITACNNVDIISSSFYRFPYVFLGIHFLLYFVFRIDLGF